MTGNQPPGAEGKGESIERQSLDTRDYNDLATSSQPLGPKDIFAQAMIKQTRTRGVVCISDNVSPGSLYAKHLLQALDSTDRSEKIMTVGIHITEHLPGSKIRGAGKGAHETSIKLFGDICLLLEVEKPSRVPSIWTGLICRSTVRKGPSFFSRKFSRVGGVVAVTRKDGTRSYHGVTCGHGLINQILDARPDVIAGDACDTAYESPGSDSDDDDQTSSESSSSEYGDDDQGAGVARTDPNGRHTHQPSAGRDLSEADGIREWTNVSKDLTASFLDVLAVLTHRADDPRKLEVQEGGRRGGGDVALITLPHDHRDGPRVPDAQWRRLETLSSIRAADEQEVLILARPNQPTKGTIVPGKFHFSVRGAKMELSRIRLSGKQLSKFQTGRSSETRGTVHMLTLNRRQRPARRARGWSTATICSG